jgi:hypothetical protein
MVRALYADFLDNIESYKASESTWENLVRDISMEINQSGEWHRWVPRTFADGTPMELDGNPIFDGRNDRLSKAFKIMQHAPTEDSVELGVWMKLYEPEFEQLPRAVLVINLSLSEESLIVAKAILKKWMSQDTSTQEMSSYLEKHHPADGV